LRLFHGSVDIRPDVICEPSGRRITTVDLPAGRARLIRASFEWSVYAHVVAAWNAVHARVAGRLHENLYFAYVGAAIIDRWIDGAPALDDAAGGQRRDLEQALDVVLAQIAAR
jgi:hypothetical protein